MVTRKTKTVSRWGAALTAAALTLPLLSAAGAANASTHAGKVPSVTNFPRNETLYTSGTSYGAPTNFNPLDQGSRQMGTMGLIYEPLFLYDPIHGKFIPWLAASGAWSNATTYVIHVRNGVKWSNGSPLTGADVAFTINLAKTNPAVPYSNLLALGMIGAAAAGNTVTVTFKSPAPYSAWQNFLWNNAILPQSIWSAMSGTAQVTGANLTPVGTGPMTLVATDTTGGAAGLGEQCYQDNPNWWATGQLGLSFHFKYLCDAVNGSNSVELSALLNNELDWSNNFLPGVNSLMVTGGDSFLKTYYPKNPYMLSANTAWLELNTSKAPMNNVNFRKAVAYAVNPQAIVSGDYDGIVEPANPTGLLPNLNSYVDQSVVKKYGFSYNPKLAKQYLAKSGYKGQTLSLMVPTGWSDWVAAVQIIATELESIGIHMSLVYPQANTKTQMEDAGNYDMDLNNNVQASSDPYSYFDHVYQLPIGGTSNEQASGLNLERYSDPSAWATLEKAATTNPSDASAVKADYSQLEKDFLQALPEIPLWYNGAWFQGNTKYWTNFPSSTNPSDQNTPVLWFSWLGATTTVYALAALRAS